MEEEKDWHILAFESQFQFFETLGSRQYDEIEKSDLFLLKKKVGFATCGKPSELPISSNYNTGYKKEELENIKSVCDKIIEKSDYNPIRFACTILILYHNKVVCETPVFRIVTSNGNIFIDAHARVYENWDNFMKNNKLPNCEYCYPVNGEYNSEKELLLSFANSPASGLVSKATDCLDTVGSVASVAAASVFAVSMLVTVAPVVTAVAGTTAACTGVYSVSRGIGSLYDRKKHEQPIGLSDRESRSVWISLASSTVGVATLAAIGKAQKIVEGGRAMSKLSVFGLHTLTASSLVFSGFGFVDTLIICADKYNKGVLTKQDVFDLSCELLFLFNAVASATATTKLVNSMSAAAVAEAPTVQKKMTKTQKRNLRKKAAKRRAKGMSPYAHEESNQVSGTAMSTTLQLLLVEAVKAYAPRVEEILYTCQSIGHDIMCWKTKEISDFVLLNNLARNLVQLYNNYKDEVSEVVMKVVKYFSSLTVDKLKGEIYRLFENASEELKSVFCTKVINMEDQVDKVINEAERDIIDFQDSLQIENIDNSSDSNTEEYENFDDSDLNPEAQHLLSGCGDVVVAASWACNDLRDFGDILDGVKHVVVGNFQEKVSNYKKSLEAAKSASNNSFNINIFHKSLQIKGDVGQHFFNETLQELTAGTTIYKIKIKCQEIQKERDARTTPVWEGLTEGLFHYYGPHGSGDLSKKDLLSVVSGVVKISLTEANCNLLEDKDVVMIEVNDNPDVKVVVYCGITEENTASGVIVVVK